MTSPSLRNAVHMIRPFLLSMPLALAACGGGGGGDGGGDDGSGLVSFNAKAVTANLADNIITQTYANLDTRADALLGAVQALAADGATEDEMEAAQNAWREARVPWETSEGFLFGPVDALNIDPAIDSWPLNTPDLQAFLAANPNATQQDVENAGDDLRGFHAIEFLLFGDGVDDNDKAATELTDAEINYLVALTQAFGARTQALVDAWTVDFSGQGPYADQLKAPGAGKIYGGDAAVLEELINGIITIADETGNAKMGEPFGISADTADTSKVESQYSWNSLTDFHNNLQSIVNIYTGKLGFDPAADTVSAAQNGLYAFVEAHDPELAQRALDELVDAQKKIALIKGDGDDSSTVIDGDAKPFREQIKDEAGRELILDAIFACNVVLATLSEDVLPLVGQTDFGS